MLCTTGGLARTWTCVCLAIFLATLKATGETPNVFDDTPDTSPSPEPPAVSESPKPSDEERQAAEAAGIRRGLDVGRRPLVAPAPVSRVALLEDAVSLVATDKDRRGIVTAVLRRPNWTFGVELSGDLDSGTTEPLDLDGLGDGSSVGVNLERWIWSMKPDIPALKALCRRHTGQDTCKASELPTPKAIEEFFEAQHAGSTPVFLGLGASLGRNRFDYLDPATLESSSASYNNWRVDANVGLFRPDIGTVSLSYAYMRVYVAGAESDLCRPLGSGGALECDSAVLSAPTLARHSIAGIEWRYLTAGQRLGMAARLARDFREDVTTVDVPLYFLSDPRQGLRGGVTVGWRSDSHVWTLRVFVGTAFSLFN